MRSAASWQPSLVTAALPSSGFSPASSPAPSVQSAGAVTTTRVITYTYDPLGRLVEADYSTGEQFEYAYDAVGNRTAMTDATGVTTYTYDDANRLTSVDGVAYTWDDRGNLVNDGTFTYLYNAAGRMVQAESVTATLVYTYNAQGLRVAQSVNGTETPFVWDWASGLPEMLSGSSNLYLIGHNTLGQSANDDWVYYLPDALGSIRQTTDDAGFVTGSREWTPFGVEVGAAQGGLGYTGEWFDGSAGFTYLRARWYDGSTGQFTQADLSRAEQNLYLYARANPVIFTDPAGTCALQPGGRTCAVEPGDRLYQIARDYIALGYHIDPITKILDWNPQFPPPAYQIYGSNIVNLCDPNDPTCPGSSGGHSAPPGDWWYGTSGYLEGWMVSVSGGLFGCGAQFVLGQEVVYDLATKPPERAMFRFVSRDVPGISGSPTTWFDSDFLKQWAIKGSLSVYAGFIWGFPDYQGIEKAYEGPATSGSVGLTLDVPVPQAPYVSMGLEAGIGKFKSDINQVQGYVGYVSGGVQVGVPSAGFGMAASVIKTNYTMYDWTWTDYGSREQPDLGMLRNHIGSGDGTPLLNAIVGFLGGPIVSEYVRNPAAEIGAYVVAQHYALGGQ